MRFLGKVVLITGAGGGIGSATANRFAMEGARVVLIDLATGNAPEVFRKICSSGGEVLLLEGNIVSKTDVDSMVDKILKRFGRIDILINNAGIKKDATVEKMTEIEWSEVIDVNLKGTFLCSKAVLKPMSDRKYGKIINTASVGALGSFGQANYSAAKAGVIGLTYTLALEYAKYNINVNCIAPGPVRTESMMSIPTHAIDMILKRVPMKRMAEPEEIAALHTFLASEEASYITGQVIYIDGGITVGI